MPRAVDLQLLALAGVAGVLIAVVVARVLRRPVGPAAVVVAWLLAWLGDRVLLDAVPGDLSAGTVGRVGWGLALAAGLLAARGVPHLPPGPFGPGLVLLSALGVWAAVPETSVVLLATGGALGVTAVGAATGRWPSPGALTTMVVGAALAAALGASGDRHALVGGLLCLATFGVLGLRPPARGARPPSDLAVALLLHLGSVVVAARHLGVSRSWGTAPLAASLVVALGLGAVRMLAARQPS